MANTPALGAGIAVQVRHSRPITSYRWSPYDEWYHLEVARFVIAHHAISTKLPLGIYPHWDTMRGRAVGSLPDSLSGGRWFESSPRNQFK